MGFTDVGICRAALVPKFINVHLPRPACNFEISRAIRSVRKQIFNVSIPVGTGLGPPHRPPCEFENSRAFRPGYKEKLRGNIIISADAGLVPSHCPTCDFEHSWAFRPVSRQIV